MDEGSRFMLILMTILVMTFMVVLIAPQIPIHTTNEEHTIKAIFPRENTVMVVDTSGEELIVDYAIAADLEKDHTYILLVSRGIGDIAYPEIKEIVREV